MYNWILMPCAPRSASEGAKRLATAKKLPWRLPLHMTTGWRATTIKVSWPQGRRWRNTARPKQNSMRTRPRWSTTMCGPASSEVCVVIVALQPSDEHMHNTSACELSRMARHAFVNKVSSNQFTMVWTARHSCGKHSGRGGQLLHKGGYRSGVIGGQDRHAIRRGNGRADGHNVGTDVNSI